MENKKGQLFFILGTSGAGKDTLINNVKKSKVSDGLHFVISYKSRPKRDSEIHGKDAHFISVEQFKDMIDLDDFIEYEKVYGHEHYYGTKYSDVIDDGIHAGLKLVKEIDMEGLKKIIKNYPEFRSDITAIFLNLTPEKFQERIKARGEIMDEKTFSLRADSFERESRDAKEYCDYIIDTSEKTPEEVLEEALKILKK